MVERSDWRDSGEARETRDADGDVDVARQVADGKLGALDDGPVDGNGRGGEGFN